MEVISTAVLDHLRDAFLILDENWKFVYLNTAASAIFQSSSPLIGEVIWDRFPELLGTGTQAMASQAIETQATVRFHLSFPDTGRCYSMTAFPYQGGLGVYAADVTENAAQGSNNGSNSRIIQLEQHWWELKKANEILEQLATTDGLTGLHNHRAMQKKLQDEWLRLASDHPLSVLLFDVDNFKKYNDSFGHPAGDEVLKRVAAILKSTCRRSDFAARYGGEEFALILPGTILSDAMDVAERCRNAVETAPWSLRRITISGGVATSNDSKSPAELINAADRELYRSKNSGRNRISGPKPLEKAA